MRGLVLVAVFAAQIPGAFASPMTVTGGVAQVESRWTDDGTRIVTEATVRTDTGDLVVVSQLGGTVDGLTMRAFPGPEPLVVGMRVTVGARHAFDLSQRPHVVVENVKVLAHPPGYVRTGPTKAGKYLYWESGCVFVTIDAAGTKAVAGEAEFAVIESALQTWTNETASCSYLQLQNDGRRDVETGRDRVNVIKFRDASWCRPATMDDPARCHPDSAAGITTATYVDDPTSGRDGAIVDADIELNGVDFAIAVNGLTESKQPCVADLKNTLTHELGHLLGIEHTCLASGDPQRVDDSGGAVPLCTTTNNSQIVEATMYNFQECGETKKSSLESDDIAAMCGIYPKASDPGTCEHVDDTPGCCQTQGGPGSSLLLSLLVGLALATRFWRRRA